MNRLSFIFFTLIFLFSLNLYRFLFIFFHVRYPALYQILSKVQINICRNKNFFLQKFWCRCELISWVGFYSGNELIPAFFYGFIKKLSCESKFWSQNRCTICKRTSDIRDIKLFLNSKSYPYRNLNLDISRDHYVLLYDMYTNFQTSDYGKDSESLLSTPEFSRYTPLIVIDCSKQHNSLKSGSIDIRLEFELADNFPAGKSAYCLILHDRIVEYNCISRDVKK